MTITSPAGTPTSPDADRRVEVLNKCVPFVLAFLAMLAFAWEGPPIVFHGDAHETWEVSKTLFAGADSYRSFVEYRGFVLFLLSAGIYQVSLLAGADDIATFHVFGALAFALLTTVSLPYLYSRLLGVKVSPFRTIIFAAIVFYFFRGYFLYPSSDYVALMFLVLAINRVLASNRRPVASLCLAGVWIGAAIFSRSNYLVCVPFLVVLAWMQARTDTSAPRRLGLGLVAFAAGVMLMFTVNQQFVSYRSDVVGPEETNGMNVLAAQLTNGLKVQRIEWSIDNSYAGMVVFEERVGIALLEEEGITGWLTPGSYLELVAKRPVQFARLYVRHLFNGIDISYSSVYVDDVRRSRLLFSFFNYTLLFAGLVVVTRMLLQPRRSAKGLVGLACLVVHALFCIPFPIEPRFFMGLVVGLHGCAVFGGTLSLPATRNLWAWRWVVLTAVLYAGFLAACFTMSELAYSKLTGEPLPLLAPAPVPAPTP